MSFFVNLLLIVVAGVLIAWILVLLQGLYQHFFDKENPVDWETRFWWPLLPFQLFATGPYGQYGKRI